MVINGKKISSKWWRGQFSKRNRTLSPKQCLLILYASLAVAALLVVFAIPASGHGVKVHKSYTARMYLT